MHSSKKSYSLLPLDDLKAAKSDDSHHKHVYLHDGESEVSFGQSRSFPRLLFSIIAIAFTIFSFSFIYKKGYHDGVSDKNILSIHSPENSFEKSTNMLPSYIKFCEEKQSISLVEVQPESQLFQLKSLSVTLPSSANMDTLKLHFEGDLARVVGEYDAGSDKSGLNGYLALKMMGRNFLDFNVDACKMIGNGTMCPLGKENKTLTIDQEQKVPGFHGGLGIFVVRVFIEDKKDTVICMNIDLKDVNKK